MKLIKISVLTTPATGNVEMQFSVLTFLLTKLRNTGSKLIRQTNAINFSGISY